MPADCGLSIEEIAAKDVPQGLSYKIVDSLNIDNDYFNAYEFHAETGADVNIEKAKSVHLNKFREARAPKLVALDVEYMKAIEVQDTQKASQIALQKQELRDVTKTLLPNDLDSLKAVWPSVLD